MDPINFIDANTGEFVQLDFDDVGQAGIKFQDEVGTAYGIKHVSNKPRVSSMPYLYDIAESNVADHTAFHRFGLNSDVGTAWETVCNTNSTYSWPTTAEQLKVVSNSAADDSGGTGAITVKIQGLDANYAVISETVALNGTTEVTTTKSFLRPLRIWCSTVGSDGVNAGIISLKNNAGSVTLLQINTAEGQSNAAIWTVPAGNVAYITNWNASESSSKGVLVGIWMRTYQESWRLFRAYALLDSSFYHEFSLPLPIAEKTDIEIRAKGIAAGAVVSAGFDGWYEVE